MADTYGEIGVYAVGEDGQDIANDALKVVVEENKPVIIEGLSLRHVRRVLFPGANPDVVVAKQEKRSATGKGAHFDVAQDFIDQGHPFLAVHNRQGEAVVQAATLPQGLFDEYEGCFNDNESYSDRAKSARYALSTVALDHMMRPEDVWCGRLDVGSTLLIPQHRDKLPIVHNVGALYEGSFIKCAVESSKGILSSEGYASLEEQVRSIAEVEKALRQADAGRRRAEWNHDIAERLRRLVPAITPGAVRRHAPKQTKDQTDTRPSRLD